MGSNWGEVRVTGFFYHLTNLDWLDLTVSQGFTYNDIIGGAGNFLASGFTHASNSVVGTFLTNAGLPTITTTFTADAFGPAMTLQALVGITRDEGGDSPFSQGISSTVTDGHISPYVIIRTSDSTAFRFLSRIDPGDGSSTQPSTPLTYGHWLQRPSDYSGQTTIDNPNLEPLSVKPDSLNFDSVLYHFGFQMHLFYGNIRVRFLTCSNANKKRKGLWLF